ncbi:hypothetical protein [Xanthocytophaga flava]|uniref:hypothetical protein n=1 Tax=Xanthocytophaga flava TaxID=3048013 RepID=UPI0028D4B84A|nr:hypothetical protein [Xanthocytophaga flavus]
MEKSSAPTCIIVDTADHIESLGKLVSQMGYTILLQTSDPLKARVFLEKTDGDINLILVDIQTGESSYTGWDLIKEYGGGDTIALNRPIVTIVSERLDTTIAYQAYSFNTREYLTKPLNIDRLQLILEDIDNQVFCRFFSNQSFCK